jgi:hypothetical protein
MAGVWESKATVLNEAINLPAKTKSAGAFRGERIGCNPWESFRLQIQKASTVLAGA